MKWLLTCSVVVICGCMMSADPAHQLASLRGSLDVLNDEAQALQALKKLFDDIKESPFAYNFPDAILPWFKQVSEVPSKYSGALILANAAFGAWVINTLNRLCLAIDRLSHDQISSHFPYKLYNDEFEQLCIEMTQFLARADILPENRYKRDAWQENDSQRIKNLGEKMFLLFNNAIVGEKSSSLRVVLKTMYEIDSSLSFYYLVDNGSYVAARAIANALVKAAQAKSASE